MWSLRRIAVPLAVCAAALACGLRRRLRTSDRPAAPREPAFDPDTVVRAGGRAQPRGADRPDRREGDVHAAGRPGGYRGVLGRRQRPVSLPQGRVAARLRPRDRGARLRRRADVGRRAVLRQPGSTGYALPAAVRRRLVRSAAKGRNGLTRTLEQFGIAPWRWETDRVAAGTGAPGRRRGPARHDRRQRRAHPARREHAARVHALARASRAPSACPTEIGPQARRAIVRSVTDVHRRILGRDEGQGPAPLAAST